MERYAWKATVLPGKLEEYIRRHNEIWPEMKDVLHQAGIRNYTIWNVGNELFGYYECDSVAEAARVQAESPVVDRWNEYMKDVMLMEMDPETGAQPLGEQLQKRGALVLRAQHFEAKIGPVKAGHDRFRLMQLQNTDDIGAHLRRGRCGKGRDSRAAREPLQKFHDL